MVNRKGQKDKQRSTKQEILSCAKIKQAKLFSLRVTFDEFLSSIQKYLCILYIRITLFSLRVTISQTMAWISNVICRGHFFAFSELR